MLLEMHYWKANKHSDWLRHNMTKTQDQGLQEENKKLKIRIKELEQELEDVKVKR